MTASWPCVVLPALPALLAVPFDFGFLPCVVVVVGKSIFSILDIFAEPHAFVFQSAAFFPLRFALQSKALLQPAVHGPVARLLKLGVVSDGQLVEPCCVHCFYVASAWWFPAKWPRYEDEKGTNSLVTDKKMSDCVTQKL